MSEDSLTTFKEKLNAGGYANVVGARRGIGKFQGMSETDRVNARALADKFFGVTGAPAAKAVEKKKIVAKKEPKIRAPKAKVVAEATKGKAAPKTSPKAPAAAKEAAAKSPVVRSESDVLTDGIRVADDKNRVIGEFISNIERVKGSLPDKTFMELTKGVGDCLNAVKSDLLRACGVSVDDTQKQHTGVPTNHFPAAPVITPAPGGLFASSTANAPK